MPTKRKKYNPDEKRKLIYSVAEKYFATTAYHEVMVGDIAKDSISAKGTIYRFVNSKEELYFNVIIDRLNELLSLIKNCCEDSVNPVSKLSLFLSVYYNYLKKFNHFNILLNSETTFIKHSLSETADNLKEEIKKELNLIIESGVKENLFKIQNIELTSSIVLSTFNSLTKKIDFNNLSSFAYNLIIKNENDFSLLGKNILLTRTFEQSKESLNIFESAGASVILFPTLEIVPPEDWSEFDEIVIDNNKIDYIIFSSTHSVIMFYNRIKELKIDFNYSNKIIVAVGNKTAQQLKQFNINVNIIPKLFSGKGVVEELNTHNLTGKIIFIPRSEIGREELPEGLKARGAILKTVPVYNITIPPSNVTDKAIEILNIIQPEIFIFTSPSTFANFCEIIKTKNPESFFKGKVVAAIGPTTAKAIETEKVKVNILPDEYTMNGLLNSIIKYYL